MKLKDDSLATAAEVLKSLARPGYFGTFTVVINDGKALLVRAEETFKPDQKAKGREDDLRTRS